MREYLTSKEPVCRRDFLDAASLENMAAAAVAEQCPFERSKTPGATERCPARLGLKDGIMTGDTRRCFSYDRSGISHSYPNDPESDA